MALPHFFLRAGLWASNRSSMKPDHQEDSTRMLLRTYEEVGFLDRTRLGYVPRE